MYRKRWIENADFSDLNIYFKNLYFILGIATNSIPRELNRPRKNIYFFSTGRIVRGRYFSSQFIFIITPPGHRHLAPVRRPARYYTRVPSAVHYFRFICAVSNRNYGRLIYRAAVPCEHHEIIFINTRW